MLCRSRTKGDAHLSRTRLVRLLTAFCFCLVLFLIPLPDHGQLGGAEDLRSELARLTPGQESGPPANDQRSPPQYAISVESNLVVLDVLVSDEDGNILAGLKKGNFLILDIGAQSTTRSA